MVTEPTIDGLWTALTGSASGQEAPIGVDDPISEGWRR